MAGLRARLKSCWSIVSNSQQSEATMKTNHMYGSNPCTTAGRVRRASVAVSRRGPGRRVAWTVPRVAQPTGDALPDGLSNAGLRVESSGRRPISRAAVTSLFAGIPAHRARDKHPPPRNDVRRVTIRPAVTPMRKGRGVSRESTSVDQPGGLTVHQRRSIIRRSAPGGMGLVRRLSPLRFNGGIAFESMGWRRPIRDDDRHGHLLASRGVLDDPGRTGRTGGGARRRDRETMVPARCPRRVGVVARPVRSGAAGTAPGGPGDCRLWRPCRAGSGTAGKGLPSSDHRMGLGLGLVPAAVCVQLAVTSGAATGLGLTKWVTLAMPGSSGYHTVARREVIDPWDFWAGYPAWVRSQDSLHIGTHPPGLILVAFGAQRLMESHPSLASGIDAYTPGSITSGFREITGPQPLADRAAIVLLATLTMLACGLTVVPLYALARTCLDAPAPGSPRACGPWCHPRSCSSRPPTPPFPCSRRPPWRWRPGRCVGEGERENGPRSRWGSSWAWGCN